MNGSLAFDIVRFEDKERHSFRKAKPLPRKARQRAVPGKRDYGNRRFFCEVLDCIEVGVDLGQVHVMRPNNFLSRRRAQRSIIATHVFGRLEQVVMHLISQSALVFPGIIFSA